MPTLVIEDKFDTAGDWDSTGGTPEIVTDVVPPSASHALKCDAVGDYALYNIPDNGYTRLVLGVWVRVSSFPTSATTRIFKIDSGPSEGWVRLNVTSGEYFISSDGTPTIASVFSGQHPTLDVWDWAQFMYDVSADPWEIRGKFNGVVISGTAAAAASNLNPGNFVLGNTFGGNTLTVHYGHAKLGIAANDDDWWDTPATEKQSNIYRRTVMVRR